MSPPPDQRRLADLRARLVGCTIWDRRSALRRLRGLERARRPHPGAIESLEQFVEQALARRAERTARLPTPTFPADLPISARRDEIERALCAHQVVVVCGETGSGKSTQLPKICLALGRGVDGQIAHTQPRRIAARSVASRLAQELGSPLGRDVGFKIRFSDKAGPGPFIKVMTDGVLLAETQGDRLLERYDTIIVDEAHERGLNIDFLLGYLRRLLPRRPDLKVIITSATIDPQRFSEHFGGAPIIEVSGRTYPVEVRYRPLTGDEDSPEAIDAADAVVLGVDECAREGPGDVLVFLPGEREIRDAAHALRRHHVPGPGPVEVMPLYSRLSSAEQDRVFAQHSGRRIVLATNVAETSLTVPGVRYVVDTGLARISRYSTRSKVQGLPIEAVSQASAAQRAGRCGRIGPGVCIRLYAQDDFDARPRFTEPEILRSNLAGVILRMEALRLGAVADFPFLDPPGARLVRDGYDTLTELGAIDQAGALTDLGLRLSRLPIDPRLGRMLLAAEAEGCLRDVLIIAAALSIQDPRERPHDSRDAADQAHRRFFHKDSDFLTLLNVWREDCAQATHLSRNGLRRWRIENHLSHIRMREWGDIHSQLHTLLTEMGHHPTDQEPDEASIHRALLSGLLSSVGRQAENSSEYEGAHGSRFSIFPGSALFSGRPRWVMAAEIVRTTKNYARMCARIRPEWIEQVGGHLLKKSHADPQWDEPSGRVVARERASLFGLEVYSGRSVDFATVDPAAARTMFIHHALVDGELRTNAPFMRHNEDVVDQVRALEEKARRHDLVAETSRRFAFFDARIPPDVASARTLDRWRAAAEKEDPRILFLRPDDVASADAAGIDPAAYPDEAPVGRGTARLVYRFEPGAEDDGVSMVVPADRLAQVDGARAEWLVPGLLKQKVVDLLRSLPRDIRRQIGPAPDLAERFLATRLDTSRPLREALGAFVSRTTGVPVPIEAWDTSALDAHESMRFVATNDDGEIVAAGRDLAAVRRAAAAVVGERLSAGEDPRFADPPATTWVWDDIPESVEIGADRILAHPALVEEGQGVALRLAPTASDAAARTRLGLRRLFALRLKRELRAAIEHAADLGALKLRAMALGLTKDPGGDLALMVSERLFLTGGPVRTAEEFERRLDQGFGGMVGATRETVDMVDRIVTSAQRVRLRIDDPASARAGHALADVRAQVAALLPAGALTGLPPDRLRHVPRYLAAAERRLEKALRGRLDADQRQAAMLTPCLSRWQRFMMRDDAQSALSDAGVRAALDHYRWMIEEFRVALFAQELGTPISVSPKRMEEAWASVEREAARAVGGAPSSRQGVAG